MCLGLPGQIVEVSPAGDFARVDVAGVVRDVNLGMLAGPFVSGEYILIHSGVALEHLNAEDARHALDAFR